MVDFRVAGGLKDNVLYAVQTVAQHRLQLAFFNRMLVVLPQVM